ncbi:MAG: rhodoquinone biosynthesis methyltransferase RquA [Kiloniellaceae bacterium]
MKRVYAWAYLHPAALAVFDRPVAVSAILWGNHGRLLRATLAELRPGQRVLQPACVYGDLSTKIAAFLGPEGRLRVCDVAPIQVANCRRKLAPFPQATVELHDAAQPRAETYDAVCCFFLLHEMPGSYKRRAVDALLQAVRPGGKAVFVDYHKPHWAHPLKGVMSLVFDTLEPFAKDLWVHEIADYAGAAAHFTWSKRTYFGGLYQKVVALRGGTRVARAQGERGPVRTPAGATMAAGHL